MINTIFALIVVFQLKHYVCDYLLQTKYMLGKFKLKGWFLPLLSHCSFHAVATLIIVKFFGGSNEVALYVAVFDLIAHFFMDWVKVENSRDMSHSNPKYWYILGFDQMFHHLTHYVIIYILIMHNLK